MYSSPQVDPDAQVDHEVDVYGRAFRTRRALRRLGPGPHQLKVIIRSTGMSRSTVHRILKSGVSEGEFRQDDRGLYELEQDPGTPVPQLTISEPAWDALHILHEATGDLVTFHTLWFAGVPHQACPVAIDGGRPSLSALMAAQDPRIHGPSSILLGAAGHAMLAHLPPRLAARVLASPPREPYGPLWREPLLDAPEQIVARGYARSASPDGWETLSAPLLSAGMVTGALSLTYQGETEPAHRSRAMHLQAHADYLQVLLDDSVRVSQTRTTTPEPPEPRHQPLEGRDR